MPLHNVFQLMIWDVEFEVSGFLANSNGPVCFWGGNLSSAVTMVDGLFADTVEEPGHSTFK